MNILRAILIAVEVITSFLLIAVILVQKTKSEGLGLAFGSGMGETLFGSRAGNVLTRLTIILTAIFLANTLVLGALFSGSRGQTSIMSQSADPMGMPPVSRPASAGAPTLPAQQPAGAPTLPGASLEDQGVSAPVVVDYTPPAEPSAPVVAEEVPVAVEAIPIEPEQK